MNTMTKQLSELKPGDEVILRNLFLLDTVDISLEKLYGFLEDNNWNRVDHPNTHISVFVGLDRTGEQTKLVLPATADLVDAQSLIHDALDLLSVSLDVSVDSLEAR